MRVLVLVLAFVLALGAPAQAERLVSTLSNTSIQITSSFAGEVLTLFGNIEPDSGSTEAFAPGQFNVIVVIEGIPLVNPAR